MELNANFTKRIVVHGAELEWQDSPMAGVKRKMLDRIGDEVARATSFVKYDPGSHFSSHVHTGGEEFIVLEGIFQDEHGDYPAGSYVRNPPQSAHTPGSKPGCVIFVKLWQFDLDDRIPQRSHIDNVADVADPLRNGVSIMPLHQDERERVRIETWSPGATVTLDTSGGAEILVLDGTFRDRDDVLNRYSWLRIPVGEQFRAEVGADGAKVWIKTGHLRFAKAPQIG